MIDAFRRFGQGPVLLASAALAGSCYWPAAPGWPMWAAVAPLFFAIEGRRPARAFLTGWAWGFVAWGAAMHWFVRVSLEYAAGPWLWRLALALGVIAYHGLMLAVPAAATAYLAGRLAERGAGRWPAFLLCAPPCFVAAEGLWPQVYPAMVAATQVGHLPAVQTLELWGPGGVAWLVLSVNALLAAAWGARSWRLAAAAAALLAANEAYGAVRLRQVDAASAAALAEGRSLRVSVLQGDLPLKSRNTGASADANIAFYTRLTEGAMADRPDLVVWPHNTYERTLSFAADDPSLERPGEEGGDLARRLKEDIPVPAAVLLSAQAHSPATGADPTPSHHFVTLLRGADGALRGSTLKVHPTPLAEFMPLGSRLPALYRLTPKLQRLIPGPSRLMETADGTKLGVYICYDGVRPGVARALAGSGAEVLVNPSSDQWSYDKATQPMQHLRIVMLRAVEDRRWYARATPSGISAVVDASGRVAASLPVDASGHVTVAVPRLSGRTPFMFLGDLAYWLAAAIVCVRLVLSIQTAAAPLPSPAPD